MPRGRTGHFGVESHDGKLLVFGGASVSGPTTIWDAIDEYDINGDTWSTIPETLELQTRTKTVKINLHTVWVYLWSPKEMRAFDLTTKAFQANTIPTPPDCKCRFDIPTRRYYVLPFVVGPFENQQR